MSEYPHQRWIVKIFADETEIDQINRLGINYLLSAKILNLLYEIKLVSLKISFDYKLFRLEDIFQARKFEVIFRRINALPNQRLFIFKNRDLIFDLKELQPWLLENIDKFDRKSINFDMIIPWKNYNTMGSAVNKDHYLMIEEKYQANYLREIMGNNFVRVKTVILKDETEIDIEQFLLTILEAKGKRYIITRDKIYNKLIDMLCDYEAIEYDFRLCYIDYDNWVASSIVRPF